MPQPTDILMPYDYFFELHKSNIYTPMAFVCIPPLVTVDQSLPIAGFDIDHTLIKPKSGNIVRPKNKDDWTWLYDTTCTGINTNIIVKKLTDLSNSYRVVAFTNQGEKTFNEADYRHKVKAMQAYLPFIEVRISYGKDNYRKPNIGMWPDTDTSSSNNTKGSFYVGDAAGREKDITAGRPRDDHSACDLFFAKNLHIPFYTPEVYFLDQSPHKPKKCRLVPMIDDQHIICLVGYPASGKSTFAKSLLINDDSSINDKLVIVGDDASNKKVTTELYKALRDGKSVIIDALNGTTKVRKQWGLQNLLKSTIMQ